MHHYDDIRTLIDRVRARWLALSVFHATVRAALAAAAVIGVGLIAARWTDGAPRAFALLAAAAVILAIAGLVWGLLPLVQVPSDQQVARFIEERAPSLDDRLVSAVHVAGLPRPVSPGLLEPMLADAARRARDVEIETIVPAATLRRAGFRAVASAIALGVVLLLGRGPAKQAVDAASLTLLPARVALQVTPGNARIKAGSPMAIEARLVGNRAPVIAQVQIADGDRWRTSEMSTDKVAGAGSFRLAMDAVTASFKYRVAAGAVTSRTYEIIVAHPPRVTRIDVDYTYPAGLRLAPRTEADSGDIYAPAGTDVRVHIFTDRPAANGHMALGDGSTHIALSAVLAVSAASAMSADKPNELVASLKVIDDTSYRVTLADRDGMSSPGETEYFIRTLEDRPPEVRILRPATDRSVTRLEEVDVEAQAEDDYGIDRLDLVYAVRGGVERIVPLDIPRKSTMVNGRHTLFLEDLNVQPGDFISYYVRARDLTRGTRPNEARSDIFFLEVKPYEQEFVLAQSQGGMAGGGRGSVDDLVNAQKEIVVATWKLDRRSQSAKGAKSEQDIHSVSRAEAELKTRVEETSSTFRESTMRDPRRRQPQRGRGGQPPPPPELKAGETLPEEDDMTAAAAAMGKAVTSLDGLKTADAVPPEMEALSRLLKAQADVKRREVMRQQSGNGSGNNRSNYDTSSLFDKELQKTQQTNYENKSSSEQREDPNQSALDKIKDLARRQDELLKRQQELARASLSEEERKRELETLTRDQSELRQKAEELARQMASQQSSQSGQQSQQNSKSGEQGQKGQKGQSGQQGKSGQQGQSGQSSQGGNSGGDSGKRMRDVSEEMRNAASELRRQDPGQASARASRALEQLRELQQQLELARPDERRRALGETQLEARQLADAQRQISSELGKTAQGEAGKDAVRRLAGEQERLAARARKLQDSLTQQASGPGRMPGSDSRVNGRGTDPDAAGAQTRAAAGDAAKDLERQRTAERMQQTADAMRAATAESRGGRGNTAPRASDDPRAQVAPGQELARALDKVADKLASATGGQDAQSQKLSEQRARAQGLREQLNNTSRELDKMARQTGRGGQGGSQAPSSQKAPGSSGKTGEGQQGGGGGSGTDLNRLRDEYRRQLQETKNLVDELRRDDRSFARGGGGFTFEAPGSMTLSAPGTEAFKQDFATWEEMRRQATQALENVESSLSKKLQARQARDRLAAGADDKAPAGYQKQVDNYFKAIAGKKKP